MRGAVIIMAFATAAAIPTRWPPRSWLLKVTALLAAVAQVASLAAVPTVHRSAMLMAIAITLAVLMLAGGWILAWYLGRRPAAG